MRRPNRHALWTGALLLAWLLAAGCGDKERNGGWAVGAGGPNHPAFGGDVGTDVAVAKDGPVYVTGVLTGSAAFGGAPAGRTELRAEGYLGKSIFLARYDSGGGLAWAVRTAATGKPDSARVAALPDGGALVAGECQGRQELDAGRAIALACEEENNLFLARYAGDGRPLWAAVAGGPAEIALGGLAVLEDGSAYLAGGFSGRLAFGKGQGNETAVTASPAGAFGLFLAGFAPDGSLAFARSWSGSGDLRAAGIDALAGGPLVVAGSFTGAAELGPGIGLASAGGQDLFAAAFDRAGEPLWASRFGGAGNEIGKKIAAASDRALAVLGQDDRGSFVARCDERGVFARTFRLPGEGFGLDTAAGGAVAVTGRFFGEAVFGSGGPNETALRGAGEKWPEDAFVALYNPDDSLAFAVRAGGPEYVTDPQITEAIGDLGVAVAIDPVRLAVYGTGYFFGQATFDLRRGKTAALASAGGFDAFLLRLDL